MHRRPASDVAEAEPTLKGNRRSRLCRAPEATHRSQRCEVPGQQMGVVSASIDPCGKGAVRTALFKTRTGGASRRTAQTAVSVRRIGGSVQGRKGNRYGTAESCQGGETGDSMFSRVGTVAGRLITSLCQRIRSGTSERKRGQKRRGAGERRQVDSRSKYVPPASKSSGPATLADHPSVCESEARVDCLKRRGELGDSLNSSRSAARHPQSTAQRSAEHVLRREYTATDHPPLRASLAGAVRVLERRRDPARVRFACALDRRRRRTSWPDARRGPRPGPPEGPVRLAATAESQVREECRRRFGCRFSDGRRRPHGCVGGRSTEGRQGQGPRQGRALLDHRTEKPPPRRTQGRRGVRSVLPPHSAPSLPRGRLSPSTLTVGGAAYRSVHAAGQRVPRSYHGLRLARQQRLLLRLERRECESGHSSLRWCPTDVPC